MDTGESNWANSGKDEPWVMMGAMSNVEASCGMLEGSYQARSEAAEISDSLLGVREGGKSGSGDDERLESPSISIVSMEVMVAILAPVQAIVEEKSCG